MAYQVVASSVVVIAGPSRLEAPAHDVYVKTAEVPAWRVPNHPALISLNAVPCVRITRSLLAMPLWLLS
jgi:hypothetical protein